MAVLRHFDDHGHILHQTLGVEKFIVGRVESCQICIVDDLASREHARFDRDPDGRYRVRDLGSRNKTFVNGEQITETLLTSGDMVRIGNRVFEFIDDTFNQDPLDMTVLTPDRKDPSGCDWAKAKQPITLSLKRIADLSLLAADVPHPARAEDVAASALGRLLIMLRGERGFVALRGESKKELRPVAHRGLTRAPGAALKPVSQSFVFTSLLQSVAGRYPQDADEFDAKSGYASTAVVAPLLHEGRTIGVVYVDRPASTDPFSSEALETITAAGAHLGMSMAYASKRLADGVKDMAPSWLTTLRRAQQAMTTDVESNEAFDIVVKLLPGAGRCGDFCDVVRLDDKRCVLLVTDAGGHGMSGLAYASGIRTAVRTAYVDPGAVVDAGELMSAINRSIVARRARQLVTCALLDIDLDQGRIGYVNAGGPPPVLITGSKRLVTLDHPSLILGIDANYGYESSTVDLPSVIRLICHTDGLIETANAAGDAFGAQRLHDFLLNLTDEDHGSPKDLVDRTVDAYHHHRADKAADDDALIVVVAHG